jgi:hypothetical protein
MQHLRNIYNVGAGMNVHIASHLRAPASQAAATWIIAERILHGKQDRDQLVTKMKRHDDARIDSSRWP